MKSVFISSIFVITSIILGTFLMIILQLGLSGLLRQELGIWETLKVLGVIAAFIVSLMSVCWGLYGVLRRL